MSNSSDATTCLPLHPSHTNTKTKSHYKEKFPGAFVPCILLVSCVCFFSIFFSTWLVVITRTPVCILVHDSFTRMCQEALTPTSINLVSTAKYRPLLRHTLECLVTRVRVVRHWKRLAWEKVESSALGMFRRLDLALM